jgi:hypothetical protein
MKIFMPPFAPLKTKEGIGVIRMFMRETCFAFFFICGGLAACFFFLGDAFGFSEGRRVGGVAVCCILAILFFAASRKLPKTED